jgi:hypothetical protein
MTAHMLGGSTDGERMRAVVWGDLLPPMRNVTHGWAGRAGRVSVGTLPRRAALYGGRLQRPGVVALRCQSRDYPLRVNAAKMLASRPPPLL